MKTIICLVGETGSGKDTVASLLPWPKVVSYTTRGIREGEKDGREHHFISEEEMSKLKNREKILAYTNKGNAEYCAVIPNETTCVYVVNPDGIEYLREHYSKEDIRLIVIGLYLPLKKRMLRCRVRSDFETAFIDRVADEQLDYDEFRLSGKYDMMITNNNSSLTADVIKEMVSQILYDTSYTTIENLLFKI